MDKEELKNIRWFSNGVWQFQPHLYFLINLCSKEELPEVLTKLKNKEVALVGKFSFKLEEEQSVER